MSATSTRLGWKSGNITGISLFIARDQSKYIRITVTIGDPSGDYDATQLCRPELTIGDRLYKWLRVCGIPLAEVDDSIPSARMKGVPVKVLVRQDGDYLNIIDVKSVA